MQPNVRVQIVAHAPLGGTGFRLRTQGGQVRLSSASSVVPQRQGTTWSLLTGWQAAERLQCFTTPCSLRCGVSFGSSAASALLGAGRVKLREPCVILRTLEHLRQQAAESPFTLTAQAPHGCRAHSSTWSAPSSSEAAGEDGDLA